MYLIRTLTLNPFIGLQLAAILQTLLLIFLIINLDINALKSKNEFFFRIILFFKEFFQGIYAIFGILMLDIALFWLLGAWSFTDWKFHLPSVIIIILLGIEYVLVPLFKKGYLLNIIYAIIIALVLGLFIHWWVPMFPVMGPKLEDNIVYIFATLVILDLLLALKKSTVNDNKVSQNSEILDVVENIKEVGEDIPKKYFWDIEDKFYTFFNLKFNFIMWILALVQSILFFSGYSLFSIF